MKIPGADTIALSFEVNSLSIFESRIDQNLTTKLNHKKFCRKTCGNNLITTSFSFCIMLVA
jgi:hypothetical protein